MATHALGTDLTLAEIIRREDPDSKLAQIVDVLSETNKVWEDGTWIQCNEMTTHVDTQAASEPAGSLRTYNQGVAKEAGVTEKVTEPTCMRDGLSEIDAKLLQHAAGGELANRLLEDSFFLRGMAKQNASDFFDGNRGTDPNSINGINNRSDYNALSSSYVYDNADGSCADASTFTSIYVIQWGYKKVNMIYPRNDPNTGSQYGIKIEDFGKNLVADSDNSNAKFPAWQTWFESHWGIFIHDPRCVKRICNIATTGINGSTYVSFDEDLLIDACVDLEYDGDGAVIYCNKTIFKQMWKRGKDKGNVNFTIENWEGKLINTFNGIPIRRVDQITDTQADVT